MKKLIIGNWKMNPVTLGDAKRIFSAIAGGAKGYKKVETVICPPNVYLSELCKIKALNVKIGAQDCYSELSGAFTGFVSPAMLKDLKVSPIILGHSEQRAAGETDEDINKKIKLALKVGLKVVLCVGEKERDEHGRYLEVIKKQLEGGLAGIQKKMFSQIAIAYEPVWAIGAQAKTSDNPEDFEHNRLFIKKILAGLSSKDMALAVPILYGGSVNKKNALDFLTTGEADGLLIGRESLAPENFLKILEMANNLS